MDAPDRWTLKVQCPECRKAGVILFAEDTHPFLRGDALIVEGLTAGFDLVQIGTAAGGTIVLCGDCGEEAF